MTSLPKILTAGAALLAASSLSLAQSRDLGVAGTPEQAAAAKEWPTFGHDSGGMRFSPLTQINAANAAKLKVAWVYHMKQAGDRVGGDGPPRGPGGRPGGGPPGAGGPPRQPDQVTAQAAAEGVAPTRGGGDFGIAEVTPLVIHGIMYITTPYGRVTALDPVTGKEMWNYKLPTGQPATRGVEYFAGDKQLGPQIVVTTSDAKIFLLDPKTGALNKNFGEDGFVNLDTPEITNGVPRASSGLSSPAVMYRNMIILGGRTTENGGPGPSGDVRAFDIHTGKLAWTFHTIPRQGEKNFGTWAAGSADKRSGVNVWGLMTVDSQRGLVYLPLGAPSGDAFGGDRAGDNLYSSSIVALNALTGEYAWHFQVVHHDIWDFDLETPPLLMNVKKAGKTIPAVAVIEKNSLLFLLDRTNGKPIYGVQERPVPQSEVPTEKTAATQPFPVLPEPLARQSMTMADVATVTPELEKHCRELIANNHLELSPVPFAPIGYNKVRVNFPSQIGGVNWPGGAFNPQLGYYFINVQNLGQMHGYKDPSSGTPKDGDVAGTNKFAGRGGPYATMRPSGRFKDNYLNMPCQQPPWGELVAVNVNTGKIVWKVPLGITENLPAELQKTGRPGIGGPIATAGGVVFVGATDDNRFRAFDAKTGKELWSAKMDAAAAAVPSTYEGKDGRQYVVVVSAGNPFAAEPPTSDAITAFALPQ